MLSKERLTIDEIVEHCKRTTKKFEKYNKMDSLENNDMDTGMMKEYLEHRQVAEYLKELKQYRDLEKQGLLLRLPVAVGSKVYEIIIYETGLTHSYSIQEYEVQDISTKAVLYEDDWCDLNSPNLYFDRAEAEEKLRELEGNIL